MTRGSIASGMSARRTKHEDVVAVGGGKARTASRRGRTSSRTEPTSRPRRGARGEGTASTNGADGATGPGAPGGLTIEQLAQETSMTVRNIRAHQSRGLIPPPEIRGRTGYYGRQHVVRLQLIAEMQADGFNLKAIERLLSDAGDADPEEVLDFKRAVTAPFEQESPELVDEAELAGRMGGENPRAISRAIKLGILVPLGEGRYEVPSPTLLRAGEELVRAGVPVDAILRVVEQLDRHAEGVAQAFVKIFLEQVWKPFDEDGRPEERFPDVARAIDRLRPLASEALLAVFQRRMTRAVEAAFGRALERRR
jgi:DNA-binding transcriptional MerR regulator